MRASLTSRIEEETKKGREWEKKYISSEKRLHNTLIDGAVRDAALESGIVPSAMDDVIHRARSAFSFENGEIIFRDPATNEIRMGEDAKTPYSPADFMKDLKEKAPHFWPSSSGAGFTGSFGSGAGADSDLKAALQKGGFAAYKELKDKQKSGK
jgi:hypothetical protein